MRTATPPFWSRRSPRWPRTPSGRTRTLSGSRIGSLELGPVIGRGGMGEVYRARDTGLERDVAVKVLSTVFARDPDRLGRFKREALILASLNHSNIAAIYGVEDLGDTQALVLESSRTLTLAGFRSR